MEKGRKIVRKIDFHGLQISIETDKGQTRHWYDPFADKHGETKNLYPYGYVRRTEGEDGEQVDIYVGPDEDSTTLYIVHQLKAPDFEEFDEEKVMAGFSSEAAAKEAYLAHYDNPKFFGGMKEMSIEDFKSEYVSKALPNMPNVPTFTYDVDILENVEHWFNNVGSMKEKDLLGLSQEVWGPGYRHLPVSQDQVRAELRGFLHDQLEMLQMQPQIPQAGDGSLPAPEQLPHTT